MRSTAKPKIRAPNSSGGCWSTKRFKNAAQMLYQREMVEKVSWYNPGEVPFEDSELEPQMTVTLYDLLLAFRDVVKRAEEPADDGTQQGRVLRSNR